MTRATTPLTEADLYEAGRAARAAVPWSSQADYTQDAERDPLGILRTQHESRLPWLVQLRVERMRADPFAFYRGTAGIQAADLHSGPDSGAEVIICGDAHLSNFGIYRSPERAVVFDINDFDEASVGPWEWDVKRLLTSVVLAGRSLDMRLEDLDPIVVGAAAMYRDTLFSSLRLSVYNRYFTPTDVANRHGLHPDFEHMVQRTMKQSEKRTSERVARRVLEDGGDGSVRFVERAPLLARPDPEIRALVNGVFDAYRATVTPNLALMLSQYTVLDVARRVVGVGSVGTRCFIIALGGPTGDVLILQLKEANPSVVQQFGQVVPVTGYLDPALLAEHQGYRVVGCQRILQAVSDPFLGYLNVEGYNFYMRLFRNRNASFEVAEMNRSQFEGYAQACAIVLARAHARSPKAAYAAGYMGSDDEFVRAVAQWSHEYADQAQADYELFVQAIDEGYFT